MRVPLSSLQPRSSVAVPPAQTLLHSPVSCPNRSANSPENLFRGLLPRHQVIAPLKCCVGPRSVGRTEGGRERGRTGDNISQWQAGFIWEHSLSIVSHTTQFCRSHYWARQYNQRKSLIYRKTQHFQFHFVHFGVCTNSRFSLSAHLRK